MGVLRSPSWLRGVLDFEISIGDDINGKVSKRQQRKEKEKRDRLEKERYAREVEEHTERLLREAEQERRDEDKFSNLFASVSKYIMREYKDCTISVPQHNRLTVEKDNLNIRGDDFSFKVTLDNDYHIPKFICSITLGSKSYNYTITGVLYVNLCNAMGTYIYDYYRVSHTKKKKSNYSKYSNSHAGSYSSTKSKPTESRELKRYNLLKTTLDGYNREYKNLMNIERKSGISKESDKFIVRNQIKNVKNKMDNMKNKYNF